MSNLKSQSSKVLIGICCLIFVVSFVVSCGQSGGGGGSENPTISVSELFNVSGAKAIATASSASSASSSISAIKSFSSANVTELLKLSSSGEISSILNSTLTEKMHPPISVIEIGPDGSLYVGFQWGIWVNSTLESTPKEVAFFKVKPDGATEVVDSTIYGVGTWYGGSENGELPVKQIQFDSSGNIYYLGKNSTGNTLLKKKTTSGTISQIGSSNYEVRDFVVTPDGIVLFHGSNVGNWSIEWLRIIVGSTVSTIFYNDGSGGLRAYYYFSLNNTNYVLLIGENLTLLDQNSVPKKYSGIIRVTLGATGAPTLVENLYDDDNMYSETNTTIGSQLTWGYWDPTQMSNKKFFVTDSYGQTSLPLSLEAGVTEAGIRSYIRDKYQSITTDTLANITFTGLTTTEQWQLSNYINDLVLANVSGKTWAKWREENGLTGVRFGNAKQMLFASSNKLYAVLRLDDWGTGTSKGDKLFQIVNEYGTAEIKGFTQDTANYFKSMSKVRACGNYAVYLSNKVGSYKIYRLDLGNSSAAPVDLLPAKSNIEIFSFDYDSTAGMLYYDVYDMTNNTSYMAQQPLTSTLVSSEVSAEGYTINDIVPFSATN